MQPQLLSSFREEALVPNRRVGGGGREEDDECAGDFEAPVSVRGVFGVPEVGGFVGEEEAGGRARGEREEGLEGRRALSSDWRRVVEVEDCGSCKIASAGSRREKEQERRTR